MLTAAHLWRCLTVEIRIAAQRTEIPAAWAIALRSVFVGGRSAPAGAVAASVDASATNATSPFTEHTLSGRRRDTGRAMSEANLVLARNAIAAFNRRDVPALAEMTTDDFEWVTWTGTVEPTVYCGAEGLAAYFRDADVWEFLNLDAQEFRDLGDRVLVVGMFHARGGGSGLEIHAPYYSAFFTSEGKLARVLSFRTEAEALEAAGLRD